MTIEPPSPYSSNLEIEAELEDYIDTLAEPIFADHLKSFAIDVVSSNKALVVLDLIDITSTLSKPGKSWLEGIELDITGQSSSITNMISAIESKGFNINSAQKILVWFKVGTSILMSEIDTFNKHISLIGSEDSEFIYGYELHEDDPQLFSCTILISGLIKYPKSLNHSFMNTVVNKKLPDFIENIDFENLRSFYFEAIYNTLLDPENKISAIKNFNHNSKEGLLRKALEITKLNTDLQNKIPFDCKINQNLEQNRISEWKKVLTVLRNEGFPFYENLPK